MAYEALNPLLESLPAFCTGFRLNESSLIKCLRDHAITQPWGSNSTLCGADVGRGGEQVMHKNIP